MSVRSTTSRSALAAIAANRFGYGVRPGEIGAIAGDPRGWLKAQLRPEAGPPALLAQLPPAEDDILTIGRYFLSLRLNGANGANARARLEREGATPAMVEDLTEERYRSFFRDRYLAAVTARFNVAIASPKPAFERLVAFWANHFTVSTAKPQIMSLPQSFEREVARAYACGRFSDLLMASTRHPGMATYLDNVVSIGPNSVWARQPRRAPRTPMAGGRPTGLNENLAREVLELHSLGVNGGYAQADVRALALLITGWMYDRPAPLSYLGEAKGTRSGPQMFKFEAEAHEPGPKTLLGKAYPEGLDGGTAALRDLSRHPSTARHIATKLVRHYVSDEPPAACVDRVARAFLDSDGVIATVMGALIDSPEAWVETPSKFKRPDEFFISAMRAFGLNEAPSQAIAIGLERMGQRPYFAPGPDGWSDMADAWMSGDLVWKRLEWSQQAGERMARADINIARLAGDVLGPAVSAATAQAIARAESPAQAVTLFLMSPEFQRR